MIGKILCVGAAGKFAGLVVPELVKRAAQVRGLTHTPDHVETVRRNGAQEAIVADLRNPASLDKALEGVERYSIRPRLSAPTSLTLAATWWRLRSARVSAALCFGSDRPGADRAFKSWCQGTRRASDDRIQS